MAKINLAVDPYKIDPQKRDKIIRALGKITTASMIVEDSLTPEQIKDLVEIFDPWVAGEAVTIGLLRQYAGELYECIQAHTTQADWAPDVVPALWKVKSLPNVIPDWVQPTGGHDAYNTGDKVVFEGRVYESKIDANTWSPTAYPAGWTDLGSA